MQRKALDTMYFGTQEQNKSEESQRKEKDVQLEKKGFQWLNVHHLRVLDDSGVEKDNTVNTGITDKPDGTFTRGAMISH